MVKYNLNWYEYQEYLYLIKKLNYEQGKNLERWLRLYRKSKGRTREKIYQTRITPVINELSNIMIKFYGLDDKVNIRMLKYDIPTIVYLKGVPAYCEERGSPIFYFSTIVKNYLLRSCEIKDRWDQTFKIGISKEDELMSILLNKNRLDKEFLQELSIYLTENKYALAKNKNDLLVIPVIAKIVKGVDLNHARYMKQIIHQIQSYVPELSLYQIRKSVRGIQKNWKKIKSHILE